MQSEGRAEGDRLSLRFDDATELRRELRKTVHHRFPHDRQVDPEVLVHHDVPHSAHLDPGNVRKRDSTSGGTCLAASPMIWKFRITASTVRSSPWKVSNVIPAV
jgi:hypothetical protein